MGEKKKFSILIVDDEKTNLDVLVHLLGDHFVLFVAKSGAAALKKAGESKPDLILLDVLMPDMNGFEVISALKSDDRTQRIPVLFITGLSDPADEEEGLRLGAVDYISKPFTPAIVHARVRTQIRILEQVSMIEEMGMVDSLTGIPNRRYFDARFQTEWRRSMREKIPISLLLLDLDRFREYNEAFGRPQGDLLLQAVGKLLEATVRRPTDLASCFGGEEFAVLLPNTDLSGALLVAEAIRSNVMSLLASTDENSGGVTVSIGVASTVPEVNASMDYFFAETDRLLRTAKSEGRNRIGS